MFEEKLTQVMTQLPFPSVINMANRNPMIPGVKDFAPGWIPQLAHSGIRFGAGLPTPGVNFPVQPLRPLAFLAAASTASNGGQSVIPPTISPVNHQYLNELIHNRDGSPTPTEGEN